MEIVNQLYKIDRRLTKPIDEVVKQIAEKKFADFVGAYELIKHNKMRKELQEGLKQLQIN